jgi:Xanthine dehydrogenase, iron-sulfur cluster and FAD-binding subunit A
VILCFFLLSLNAYFLFEGINNFFFLPINNFFIGYRKTKLKKNEFIRSIKIPLFKKNIFKSFKISQRFEDDISSICGSFNIKIINNTINQAYIANRDMATIPKISTACEKILKNN